MTFIGKVHKLDHRRRHLDLQKSDYSSFHYSIDRGDHVQWMMLNCLGQMDAKHNERIDQTRGISSSALLRVIFQLMDVSWDFLLGHI